MINKVIRVRMAMELAMLVIMTISWSFSVSSRWTLRRTSG